MKGRLESELARKNEIKRLLNNLPEYVEDLYMIMQVDRDSSTCLTYINCINNFHKQSAHKDDVSIMCSTKEVAKYFEKINYVDNGDGEIRKTSASYRKTTWTALNHLFTHLVHENIIDKNPLDVIGRPKKRDNVERYFMTPEELKEITNTISNGNLNDYAEKLGRVSWENRDKLIISLLMITGMRRTALCEINVKDVSFKNKTITVTDKRDKIQVYKITKNIEKLLRIWLEERKEILGDIKCDALFISERRKRICSRSLYDITKKYSVAAIGKTMCPHNYRRAFIRNTYKKNNDIEAAKKAAGHESISTTMLYIEDTNSSRDEAMDYMDSILFE